MASSSGSSGQPRKIILLRRNIEPSVKCEVVNEAAGYVYLCNFEDVGVNVCCFRQQERQKEKGLKETITYEDCCCLECGAM
jgi:hypothetical protein